MKKYKLLEDYNEQFVKILDFYLFNCPVKFSKDEKVSKKSSTFEDMKIKGVKLTSLLNKIKKTNIEIMFLNKTTNIEDNNLQIRNAEKQFKNKNYIILYENKSIGKTKTIFYYIRNSLAHGAFNIKEKNIIGECTKKNLINAKFKIEKNVLLEIIDLILNID